MSNPPTTVTNMAPPDAPVPLCSRLEETRNRKRLNSVNYESELEADKESEKVKKRKNDTKTQKEIIPQRQG